MIEWIILAVVVYFIIGVFVMMLLHGDSLGAFDLKLWWLWPLHLNDPATLIKLEFSNGFGKGATRVTEFVWSDKEDNWVGKNKNIVGRKKRRSVK